MPIVKKRAVKTGAKGNRRATLKLQIEMIPESAWGKSLRKSIKRSQWDKIRREVHVANGNKCELCGANERLECHEEWDFNDSTHTLRLRRLGTVCNMCHHVSHFGRALQLHLLGYLDLDAVVDHFMKVNMCDLKAFERHQAEAGRVFAERCKHQWSVDFGSYTEVAKASAASGQAD